MEYSIYYLAGITYFLIINLFGLLLMGIDKRRAKKRKWRISEQFLFTIACIGGALGMIFGSGFFRHKTKKPLFTIGLPIIFIVHALIFSFIII